ncbi:3371_t:CDS:2 [Entrophospora sp. SA101]|nr:14952_t:CDS:2 [Entrophospora sp. SA101]CAJ0649788.1 3371_t:CDS:2 [Entrophospora sp. SA101]CAJ0827064.1 4065_t:CDS:2 [Entrophospora sp. SA101]
MDKEKENHVSDQEIARLFRVYTTVHQMVLDRGYLVTEEICEDVESFKLKCLREGIINREAMMFQVQKSDNPNDQMLIVFPEDRPVGVKYLKVLCQRMMDAKITKGIVIYPTTLTAAANKAIQLINSKETKHYEMEAFSEADCMVNITRHQLVPNHIVLTDEEKKSLLQTQLPRIQMTDPVAKYYGLKRGQVVKIMRPSETSGRSSSNAELSPNSFNSTERNSQPSNNRLQIDNIYNLNESQKTALEIAKAYIREIQTVV